MSAPTEQTSRPLDSAEISRMFDAMRSGTFTATPETGRPAKSAFVAKSLFDIARAASPSERPVPGKMAGAPLEEIEDAEVLSEEPAVNEHPSDEMRDPEQDEWAQDASSTDAAAQDSVGDHAQAAAPSPDPGPRPANPDELKAEWGRGFAAGEAHSREQMSATVEERLAVLDAAVAAFRSAEAVATLRQEIVEAVTLLASSRAGAQIDDMPTPYLAKIEDLVDRIRNSLAQPRLRMNPDDYAAVKPYLVTSETMVSIAIATDPGLARGDFEVSTDSLRYADKMASRPTSPSKSRRRAATLADGDQDSMSDTPE